MKYEKNIAARKIRKDFLAAFGVSLQQLAEITLADFQSRNFSRPIRQFTADSRVALPSQPIITYFNERLILTNSDKLERWEIRNNPSYVIRPGGK